MFRITLAAALVLLVAGCSDSAQPSGGIDSLSVSRAALTLAPEETFQLAATPMAHGDPLTGATVAWSSSDTSLAQVTPAGMVSARAAGNLSLIARSGSDSVVVPLRVVSSFQAVQMTEQGACALRVNGAIWCWGGHWPATGAPLDGGGTYAGLAGGGVSVDAPTFCALDAGQVVNCWGDNISGALLGRGVDTVGTDYVPAPVSGGLVATSVAVGYFGACAVTPSGASYCWGRPKHSELAPRSIYGVPDSVTTAVRFSQVATARYFSCGLSTAGAAYCWGMPDLGALGVDSVNLTDQASPIPVAGGLTFAKLAVGYDHPCGLTTSGEIWCWGENDEGEAGVGVTSRYTLAPVHSASGLHFTDVAAGDDVSCGIATDGVTYCWGAGNQLGAGDQWENDAIPNPAPVAGGHRFARIFSGHGAICGVTAGGAAYCWGNLLGGNLGDGVTNHSTNPIRVLDP